jgi:uncharacterized protein (TIGR00251 family)
MSLDIKKVKSGIRFPVTLQPRASRNEISGLHNGALKIRLTSPPVEGAANRSCIKFLAKTLGTSSSSVQIVSGLTNRNKVVEVVGMDEKSLLNCLSPYLTNS